jgi:hypothetical protein
MNSLVVFVILIYSFQIGKFILKNFKYSNYLIIFCIAYTLDYASCKAYTRITNGTITNHTKKICSKYQRCCGRCDVRYCCSTKDNLDESNCFNTIEDRVTSNEYSLYFNFYLLYF